MSDYNVVSVVYETRNYEMFKKLLGNRDVTESRVQKIMNSIKNVGYVMNPCVINMRKEVIDGQGRIEALKRLGLPVHFVIDNNAGLEQCVQLNINGTPWHAIDYVESYASQGKQDYINLLELVKEFPDLGIGIIAYAVDGNVSRTKSPRANATLAGRSPVITGLFKCSEEDKKYARQKLEYARKFIPICQKVNGATVYFIQAVIFAAFNCPSDKDRLYEKVFALQQNITPFTNVKTALASLTEVYNNRNRQERVNFEVEYAVWCQSKNPSYIKRWIKKEEEK